MAHTEQPSWWQDRYSSKGAVEAYLASHQADLLPARTALEVDTVLSHAAAFMPIVQDMPVLDGYCGNGRHGLELTRRGFSNVTSFDYSLPMTQVGRRAAQNEGLNVGFVRADARTIPFGDNSVSLYQAHNTSFVGFFDNPGDDLEVMKEARRVVKPGGILAFDLVDMHYALTRLADIQTTQKADGVTIDTHRKTWQGEDGAFTEFTERHQDTLTDQKLLEKTIKIRVFDSNNVTGMLQEAGFERVSTVPHAFAYDKTGAELGTRGVRNLYVAQ